MSASWRVSAQPAREADLRASGSGPRHKGRGPLRSAVGSRPRRNALPRPDVAVDVDAPSAATRSGTWLAAVLLAVPVVLAVAWLVRGGPAVREGGEPMTPQLADPASVPDPTEAGPLPDGYRRVLGRDRIRPIYAPRYRAAADTDWSGDTLVLGVAIAGEARAYPVRVLNHREMVLDRLGGTPILATW